MITISFFSSSCFHVRLIGWHASLHKEGGQRHMRHSFLVLLVMTNVYAQTGLISSDLPNSDNASVFVRCIEAESLRGIPWDWAHGCQCQMQSRCRCELAPSHGVAPTGIQPSNCYVWLIGESSLSFGCQLVGVGKTCMSTARTEQLTIIAG